eukprot:TRINITY_DN11978_c0_g1_i2.p1 TRINITY_DN11978_c0_g1~~TRINITY_DN11978_c0_g1_i2.p1  ORF type:complete len:111 (+),score=10.74 TRINITY_DN11978_c0_g1_i2:420-752(+)
MCHAYEFAFVVQCFALHFAKRANFNTLLTSLQLISSSFHIVSAQRLKHCNWIILQRLRNITLLHSRQIVSALELCPASASQRFHSYICTGPLQILKDCGKTCVEALLEFL